MHPNPKFHWQDKAAIAEFVREIGFGALFASTPHGPRVAMVPAMLEDDRLVFHLARGNALARHLDGAVALYAVAGPDAYVSPDWYGEPDQVPTWNYVSVELEGVVERLDDSELPELIDRLTAEHERRLAKQPWTRAKMSEGLFAKMARAITGYALDIRAWRGTLKLGQNKTAEARTSAAEAIEASGRPAIAHWMRAIGE